MALSQQLGEITEFRGVSDLVAAEIITDTGDSYTTGEVFSIAGVAEISRTTASESATHFYDNMPAIVLTSTGADTITCTVSVIALDVLAKITGQTYDEATGALIEGSRDTRYFALGYKTKRTNGAEMYVWRLKGMFNIPESTHITENDGTDANGQELVFTGISTTHRFAGNGNKGATGIVVDVSKGLADVSAFFDEVTTPDTLVSVAPAAPVLEGTLNGTAVDLSWTEPDRAASFKVFRWVPGIDLTIEEIYEGTDLTHTDTEAAAGHNNLYYVIAYSDTGAMSPSSNTITLAPTPSADAPELSVTLSMVNVPTLTWTDASAAGTDVYELIRWETGKPATRKVVYSGELLTFTDNVYANQGTGYNYVVVATNALRTVNNESNKIAV